MLYYNIFNSKSLDFYRKEYLRGSIFIQSFSLSAYDELKCRSFMVLCLNNAAFRTLTDHEMD